MREYTFYYEVYGIKKKKTIRAVNEDDAKVYFDKFIMTQFQVVAIKSNKEEKQQKNDWNTFNDIIGDFLNGFGKK